MSRYQEHERKLAISKKFKLLPDDRRGYGWFRFVKGHLYVWSFVNTDGDEKWQTAELTNGNHFTNLVVMNSLDHALDRVI